MSFSHSGGNYLSMEQASKTSLYQTLKKNLLNRRCVGVKSTSVILCNV
jgi:hypothetical protein